MPLINLTPDQFEQGHAANDKERYESVQKSEGCAAEFRHGGLIAVAATAFVLIATSTGGSEVVVSNRVPADRQRSIDAINHSTWTGC